MIILINIFFYTNVKKTNKNESNAVDNGCFYNIICLKNLYVLSGRNQTPLSPVPLLATYHLP